MISQKPISQIKLWKYLFIFLGWTDILASLVKYIVFYSSYIIFQAF